MQYDLLIIGGGPGGFAAATRAARHGLKAGLFESREIGGTCLNRGCIPTKTLMHSAELLESINNAGKFGINTPPVTADFGRLRERKDEVSRVLRSGMEATLKASKVDIIRETAQIIAPGRILAGGIEYEAESILIATGSKPSRPPIPGLEHAVTSDEILRDLPEYSSLVIIGGGVIGVELGCLYASLGCRVTIVEALERIVFNLDSEISQNLSMIMKKRGIEVHAGASVSLIERTDSGFTVSFTDKNGAQAVTAQAVLAATGRSAVTDGIPKEIELVRGCISVDENFMTTMPGVYAIGDAIGGVQLAHKAEYEGIAAAGIIAGAGTGVNTKVVPACVYTNPEIASVGITADEAKARGIEVKSSKHVMGGNAKTLIEGSERSFIKLVAEAESGKILGAHMMCGRATDMIGEFVTAIVNGMTVSQLGKAMRPHPSFSEVISHVINDK